LAAIAPYFQRLDPSEEVAIGRIGRSERVVTLTHAHVLLRPYPLPFGDALWTALSAPPFGKPFVTAPHG
jgi:hypothetical protein